MAKLVFHVDVNTYADELHKEILPLGLSVYEVFGKLLNLSTAPTVEFTVNDLTKITKDQYASIMYCVCKFLREKIIQIAVLSHSVSIGRLHSCQD